MNKKSETETLLMTTVKMILVVGVILFIFLPLIMLFRNFLIRSSKQEDSAKHLFETISDIISNEMFWEMLNYSYTFILPYPAIAGDYAIALEPSQSFDDSIIDDTYLDLILYKDSKPLMKKSFNYFRASSTKNYFDLNCGSRICYLDITFNNNEEIPTLEISSDKLESSVTLKGYTFIINYGSIGEKTVKELKTSPEKVTTIVVNNVQSSSSSVQIATSISSSPTSSTFTIENLPKDKITSIKISCLFNRNKVQNFPTVKNCGIGEKYCTLQNVDFCCVSNKITFQDDLSCSNNYKYEGVNANYEYTTVYDNNFFNKLKNKPLLLFPVKKGRITSIFGEPRYYGYHKGIDIAPYDNSRDIPIYASHDGKVIFSGITDAGGITIKIRSLDGKIETLYAHLNKVFVFTGQQVRKGEIIGIMGNTGRSTGIHLHYEVRLCNYGSCVQIDPVLNVDYLNSNIYDLKTEYAQQRNKYSNRLFKTLSKGESTIPFNINYETSIS
ncbi:MAG: M23 family metallopeptidase [Candidatus Woesearchaeota archaeon]